MTSKKRLDAEAHFQDQRAKALLRTEQRIFYEHVGSASQWFSDACRNIKPASILIVGCGDEDVTRYCFDGVKKIVAMDIAPESIEKVRSMIQTKKPECDIQAFVMDAHSIGSLDTQFDAV